MYTRIHMYYKLKYILKCFRGSFLALFRFIHKLERGVAWRDPSHVIPKVKWFMHAIFSVCCSKGLSGLVQFLAFFWHDMKTEMGVIIYIYLKHSLDYIDSNYIRVHWSDSLSSVFFLQYHFWHFSFTHGK